MSDNPVDGGRAAKQRTNVRLYRMAADAVEFAKAAQERAFQRAYPIGATVEWVRGNYRQSGVVMMHGYGDRLRVANSKTGNKLWITGYELLEADRG